MIHKIKEYEDLLREIKLYFYKTVDCRVETALHHRSWVEKINKVIYNAPKKG